MAETEENVKLTLLPYLDDLSVNDEVIFNFIYTGVTGEDIGVDYIVTDPSIVSDNGGILDLYQHEGYFSFSATFPGTTQIKFVLYKGYGADYRVLASETVSITVLDI